MEASRGRVYYFKHNDMQDLERLLKRYDLDYTNVSSQLYLAKYVRSCRKLAELSFLVFKCKLYSFTYIRG